MGGCSPSGDRNSVAEARQTSSNDCPAEELSCGKQKPVRSNGRDPFVNDDMQIRATFASGSEVCLTRSGDVPRGFFVLLEPMANPCTENPDRKSFLAIDSNYNSIDHRTLLEAAFGDCDPLPAAIRAHVSKRDFSIPHHRILVCGESVSTGIGLTVYAMGGGMADSGEYMTQRIEYRATLATTEQRAKADLAVFREFLSSLELGFGTD
jgi:hypothetical protein